ncbi:hypothetical protein AVEN_169891-1 [Araneus ventricosus]|uniref:Uncharacterized protein n=1 Tax=Araneus ventricosus TaxID=182803 RepID=A0A4Y2IK47_ARAVE|nr:hypothetical protein AVEN_169891-1 [Araneus ventricosus]
MENVWGSCIDSTDKCEFHPYISKSLVLLADSGSLMVRSQPRGRRVPGSKLDFTADPSCMRARRTRNPMSCAKRPPPDVAPAQAPPSPSDHGSKLRWAFPK